MATMIENRKSTATMRCENCRWFHRLKHNFKVGKGFEKGYACDVLLHTEESDGEGWIQEVVPDEMCEMFEERKVNK